MCRALSLGSSQAKSFLPPEMMTDSGQLFVDFDGREVWEETELEHVGTPSLCISTLRIKINEALGRLNT